MSDETLLTQLENVIINWHNCTIKKSRAKELIVKIVEDYNNKVTDEENNQLELF